MLLRALMLVSLALAFGCGDHPTSSQNPVAPSSTAGMTTAHATTGNNALGAVRGREDVRVSAMDACDPTTFNTAVGPGTCSRSGGVQFDNFIEQLTRHGSVGAWHFAPPVANARTGETFLVTNRGGEVHTFTEVEDFGGGIVPDLNRLAGVPNVAPECLRLEPDDFIAPGATYQEEIEETGHEKYQCCIHPWMRLEADVKTQGQ